MTIKNKQMSPLKVDGETYKRFKLLSKKSGFSLAEIARQFSLIADCVPDDAEKIGLLTWVNDDKKLLRCLVSPIICGSFEVPETMEQSDDLKLVHSQIEAQIKKRMATKND